MRKHDIVKTIQLIIFILLTAFGCYKIFTNHSLYHMIASDPDVRIMFALLWFVLGLSFFFIFLDFSFSASYKKDYRELDFAVHSDPVAGIANRYSCDALIEKYLDRPLPDTLGCIMFDLTNIQEINTLYGHLQGNAVIRDFSNILKLASVNMCFVGRNGFNMQKKNTKHKTELSDYEASAASQETDPTDNPESQAIRIDEKEYLMRQVLNLPFTESQVIFLKYYQNMKLEDIAKMLDISRSSVKRYLISGRRRLKQLIEH